ncbi:vWA domain-containing protein [Rhodopirellula halodulae]|uniref:vWA domain-containing protein n=1 Tax=Rhodopirellula halodulae TaxID=2894198 RepID=UPI001E2A8FD8|nr:vWA domain-containing protein [Rhodopirellula sp. JC737]MCC9657469.1 VWA domain-containing protein [Rhodopirellula sp. JC737]
MHSLAHFSQASQLMNETKRQSWSCRDVVDHGQNITSAKKANSRRGAMLVLIAIMMFLFLIIVAFSIDIAQMHLSRTELRASTDAAANAAATTLADTLDRNAAIRRGQQIARANLVNGQPLLLGDGDFQFGRSERQPDGKYAFTGGQAPFNGVRVNGQRTTGSLSGPVPLFFGNITGTSIFEPEAFATATYVERDVTLVVDRSGSMSGSRFADLRAAIQIFTDLLATTPVEEQIGLASYNDRASEDVQLTENFAEITDAMGRLRTGGFTSISRGMQAGQQIARRGRPPEFVERTMIVMTDGRHNRGPEPRTVATSLAADDVTIHTITFGAGADIARMREVATIGGGRHFHATNGEQLREIYREIALTLGTVLTE